MSHPHTRMDKPTAEYYCFVRSMIMTEFPCPPLPVAGHRTEDSERAVLNSHDMISTLMITALKMQDTGFNERRRVRQEELETQYQTLIDQAGSFNEKVDELLAELQLHVNAHVSKFSQVQLVLIQPEPFERTPTMKIKRFLYV